MELEQKYKKLQNIISEMDRVVIGYSGGVDSSFLLKVAVDVLGDNVLAVLSNSATYPTREYDNAVEFAKSLGVRLKIIATTETDVLKFQENPPDRCYFCKTELFTKLQKIAEEEGIKYCLDGSNIDDVGDFRPGMRAVKEQNVRSPLREAGFTKEDIRKKSKELGMPTWNRPALPCLSSRFPYGVKIDEIKLGMVDRAENFLVESGFRNVRVRHHDQTAKIEIPAQEINKLLDPEMRNGIVQKLKTIGYKYVTLDLEGFRSGSMNETLTETERVKYIG